jgi:hypothetical protein
MLSRGVEVLFMRQIRVLAPLLIGLCSLPACDRGDILEIIGEVRPGDGTPVPGSERIPFEVFSDEVGDLANVERRVLLKTADGYRTFFGHAAPAVVDFSREWVIFYSAGRRPSTGFEASVRALARAGARLHAVTQLQSPGRTCIVGDAITTPHVLVKFRAQPETTSIDFSRVDSVDCSPTTNPCAAILCRAGTHCVVLESFAACPTSPPPTLRAIPVQLSAAPRAPTARPSRSPACARPVRRWPNVSPTARSVAASPAFAARAPAPAWTTPATAAIRARAVPTAAASARAR